MRKTALRQLVCGCKSLTAGARDGRSDGATPGTQFGLNDATYVRRVQTAAASRRLREASGGLTFCEAEVRPGTVPEAGRLTTALDGVYGALRKHADGVT